MERDTAVEAGVALGAVVLFIAIIVLGGEISTQGLTHQGAYAVIAGVVAFVVVMAAAGFYLAGKQE